MASLQLILLVLATVLTTQAYVEYYRKTVSLTITPNRWSWLIWTAATGVEIITFHAVSTDILTTAVFLASFAACFLITLAVWRSGAWRKPSGTEIACATVSVVALTLALVLGEVWWGHLLALIAIPLSFLPTFSSAWEDYRREDTHSWMLWTLGDLCALGYVAVRLQNAQEIPYAAVEAASHGGVWLIVAWGRFAAQRRRASRARDTAWLACSSPPVTVGQSHLGRAVFAARDIDAGAIIMQFGGTPLLGSEVPRIYLGAADRYMQIDHDLYLGPSGHADDFVNHSCDPNVGIRFASYGILLVALRGIRAGEEISWDYSTTIHDTNWVMRCDCRTSLCRRYVGEFLSLPKERRDYYLAAGTVAPYIVKSTEPERSRAEHLNAAAAAPDASSDGSGQGTVADLANRLTAFAREPYNESRRAEGGAAASRGNVSEARPPRAQQGR